MYHLSSTKQNEMPTAPSLFSSLMAIKGYKLSLAWVCFFIWIASFYQLAHCQSPTELANKKAKVEKKIQQTQKKLADTKEQKEATLKNYSELQKKITSRASNINTVKVEINSVSKKIKTRDAATQDLKKEIEQLKAEYANVMRRAYKSNLMTNEWMLILSSSSINQGFQTWQYLRKFKKERQRQAQFIAGKQLELENELFRLTGMKNDKEYLLQTEQKESKVLVQEIKSKNS